MANKKYEFVGETKVVLGVTLQIGGGWLLYQSVVISDDLRRQQRERR